MDEIMKLASPGGFQGGVHQRRDLCYRLGRQHRAHRQRERPLLGLDREGWHEHWTLVRAL